MPPKRKRKQVITTVDTIAALDRVQLPSNSFSRGAVEALRVCHAQFVSLLAAELALLCSDTVTVTLQPSHVDQCLEKLGMAEYKRQTIKTTPAAAAAPRANKRKKWSAVLQAEQEKLLTQSKQTMQKQQQTQQQQQQTQQP